MTKKTKKKTDGKKKVRKSHKLASFISSLIIILAAGGAVFWFGWVQFSLNENEYAVIYTKTNGYESQVLKNGEFAWRWQALLPTNLSLHTFNIENKTFTIKKNGELPSGDTYAKMTGEDISFDWNISVEIIYHLNPEALPALVSQGLLTSGLESFYSDFETGMNSEIAKLISAEVAVNPEETTDVGINHLEKSIKEKALDLNKNITLVDVRIKNWDFPDLTLYSETRRLALDLMNKRQSVLSEVEDSAVRRKDLQDSKLNLLEEYGSVLQKYPILLDLFSLEGHPGTSLLPSENE